jgi:hypothetical protein
MRYPGIDTTPTCPRTDFAPGYSSGGSFHSPRAAAWFFSSRRCSSCRPSISSEKISFKFRVPPFASVSGA